MMMMSNPVSCFERERFSHLSHPLICQRTVKWRDEWNVLEGTGRLSKDREKYDRSKDEDELFDFKLIDSDDIIEKGPGGELPFQYRPPLN